MQTSRYSYHKSVATLKFVKLASESEPKRILSERNSLLSPDHGTRSPPTAAAAAAAKWRCTAPFDVGDDSAAQLEN